MNLTNRKDLSRKIDKALAGGIRSQLAFLISFITLVFVILFLIAWGFSYQSCEMVKDTSGESLLWSVYYHFIDAGNQHMANEGWPRGLVAVISIFGSVLMSGLLISTFSNILERRMERYRKGTVFYTYKDHIVVIGFDDMVPCLVRQICNNPAKYGNKEILLQTSRNVEEARLRLHAELTDQEENRVSLIYAKRNQQEELEKMDIWDASEIFILGESLEGDSAEYAHDSLNLDCLNRIGSILREHKTRKKIPCHVLFDYQTTSSVFQFSDLTEEIKEHLVFYPFNFSETWARKILVGGTCVQTNIRYQWLDREPITADSTKTVHLVIVGMSKMGVALAIEAAHTAHYPNFVHNKNLKTCITFIDCNARQEMNFFKGRYKNLFDLSYSEYIDLSQDAKAAREIFNPDGEYQHLSGGKESFIDIEWKFINGQIESPAVRDWLTQQAANDNQLLTLAVCFNFQHTGIAVSLYLPPVIYEKDIPVWVLQRESQAIIENAAGLNLPEEKRVNMRYKNLRPFGMKSDCYDLTMSDDTFAKRVKHTYYHARIDKNLPEYKTEEVEATWQKYEEVAKKWSNIYCANSIPVKLRSMGYTREDWDMEVVFTEEETELLAEVEHNRWNVEKLLMGYRPVTAAEDEHIRENIQEKGKFKSRFIHYDIRPFRCLHIDDQGNPAGDYDRIICRHIPLIIK